MSFDDAHRLLTGIFEAQTRAVSDWHAAEPQGDPALAEAPLEDLALRQHLRNFRLWHVEDTARRRDVGPEVIAECKRAIDGLNQQRNDLIEKVDACLLGLVGPHLPADAPARHNTESVGCALDRMSILSLKIFHMAEQTARTDVDQSHRDECGRKLGVLEEQRSDLGRAVLDLLDDYRRGLKRPKVYYQFKMYNDPRLNPELYGGKK